MEEGRCDHCHRIYPLPHKSLDGRKHICRDCFADTDGVIPEVLGMHDRISVAVSNLIRGINPKLKPR